MARRGRTIPELRWRDTPDFVEVAKSWRKDSITVLVGLVWQGYDLLGEEVLSEIDCNQAEEQLERSITQLILDDAVGVSPNQPLLLMQSRRRSPLCTCRVEALVVAQ